MIPALLINDFINENNYSLIPGIKALEYRNTKKVFGREMDFLFHSGLGIVQDNFIDYFNSIVDFLNENKFKIFSFDLGPAALKVKINHCSYYVPESKVLSKITIEKLIRKRLEYIRSKYHGDLALENLNYFPTPAYQHVCEGDFISEVICDNNVSLLLDIAHGVISAQNLDIDRIEYFNSLPLNRIKEIHINHPEIVDEKMCDLHKIPSDEEYHILDRFRKQIPSEAYLVVECSADCETLEKIYMDIR